MTIAQLGAPQNLVCAAGSPFSLTIDATLKDANGNVLPSTDLANVAATLNVGGVASAEAPSVALTGSQIVVSWTAAQTTALLGQRGTWSVTADVAGTGPYVLVAGTLTVVDPTTPGVSTSTTTTLTVEVGTATATLGIVTGATGPAGVVQAVTAADSTITIGGTTADPTVKVTANTFDAYGAAATAQANAEAASIPLTQKGTASGVAELDATANVPAAELGNVPYAQAAPTVLTSSASGTVPAWANHVRYRLIGGGAGGGGGGSALTSGGISNQAGGAGGTAAGWSDGVLDVTPGESWSVTVGAGGSGGTSGAANGGNGGNGTSGGATTLSLGGVIVAKASGGEQDQGTQGSQGNSSLPGGANAWSYGSGSASAFPGVGGGYGISYPEQPWGGPVLFGGGVGGTASATNGGGAGGNPNSAAWLYASPGGTGASATANGVSAVPTTSPGCGGAGGGGGAPGGTGGAGSAGGNGVAFIEWLP